MVYYSHNINKTEEKKMAGQKKEELVTKKYLVSIESKIHRVFKMKSVTTGRNLTELVNEALTEWLENKGLDASLEGNNND